MSEATAQLAFGRRSQFNVIDINTAWKIDMIMRKDRPFGQKEFTRRLKGTIQGLTVMMTTPEDTILSKLDWAKSSRSEIQLRDVTNVLRINKEKLDYQYLNHWAGELGVATYLQECLAKIEESDC